MHLKDKFELTNYNEDIVVKKEESIMKKDKKN